MMPASATTVARPSGVPGQWRCRASGPAVRLMERIAIAVVCHDKWHLLYTLFGTVRSSPPHTTSPVTSNNPPYGN